MNRTITIHEESSQFGVIPSWNGHFAQFRIITKDSVDLLTELEANRLADNLIAAFLELEQIKGVRLENNCDCDSFNNGKL